MGKPIHEYDLEGRFITSYDSIASAATAHKVDESCIRKCGNGLRHSSANRRWSYHKAESLDDLGIIEDFITNMGLNPDEVVKTRIHQNASGEERISVESVRKSTSEDIRTDMMIGKLKQLQRKTDETRVLRKEFREHARVENALTALNESLVELLTDQTFKPVTYEHPEFEGPVLIVQVTDAHFNELVTLPDNLFNFVVGAKRLQKYAGKIRKFAEIYKVKNIVLALTGDIINSDRRLDEMINQSTNRMKAAIIATQILYHFIQDVNRSANIKVIGVSGNESRVKIEHGMSELAMSDNYDYLVYNMLKLLFAKAKGITFVDGDPVEQVINVNNSNILVTHGTTIKEGQAAMQQIFGKYAAKGILLDYAIFGHVHFTNITDIYSRSGSIVGNNVYSDRYLNLVTKASQVVHVVEKDGSIDTIKVSLQYTDKYPGYDIKDDLTAYNSLLTDNARERETIVQIVI